jgi:ABC-type tungstate transport system substrate-binding protein
MYDRVSRSDCSAEVRTLRGYAAGFALAGALWIVYGHAPWRVVLLGVFNLGLGLPPVAVGLAVAFAFWRSGPLRRLDLLYTAAAMVIAQTIVITPLIDTLAVLALHAVDAVVFESRLLP